jgi:hypothetical protein
MISMKEAIGLALALPETTVQDHHGIPSLRVRGKIFATVPDEQHVRVMVDRGEILAAVAEDPEACSEFWWGSRLAAVLVDLRLVAADLMGELLQEAWRRKAPSRLAGQHASPSQLPRAQSG